MARFQSDGPMYAAISPPTPDPVTRPRGRVIWHGRSPRTDRTAYFRRDGVLTDLPGPWDGQGWWETDQVAVEMFRTGTVRLRRVWSTLDADHYAGPLKTPLVRLVFELRVSYPAVPRDLAAVLAGCFADRDAAVLADALADHLPGGDPHLTAALDVAAAVAGGLDPC